MQSVADLVEEPQLARLASSDALDAGRRLADSGAVHVDQFGPLTVTATVEGAHDVELRSGSEGLEWSCTCPPRNSRGLCEHAVAVAVETSRRSPSPRD